MNTAQAFNFSPLLSDLRTYKPEWLPKDLIAGLSVAAVQIPTAVAYAQLAGFSPEIGLYSSILPVMIYGIFGSSRQLVVGPDAATCTMVASLVAPLAGGDPAKYIALSSGLSLTAGILMIVGGFAHMGFIVNFFARPILIGFLNGIAASIIAGQSAKMLGLTLQESDFLPSIVELTSLLGQTHWPTLATGLVTMAILFILQRLAPKAPAALLALIVATAGLMMVCGSGSGVKLVGAVPAGLPHLGLPEFGYRAGQGLLVSALGLVVVSFTSGMLTARSIAARSGQSIDANQEMLAIGAANLAAGVSGGFAITGADSRTAVNAASGNKTQLSSVFAAIATGCVALYLTGMLGLVPLSALAAVLIVSAIQLFDFSSLKELEQIDPFEHRLALLTTAGVLTLGVLPGVAVAITCALITIFIRLYNPDDSVLGLVPGMSNYNDVSLSPESKTFPGLIIWRFEAPLLFFNADRFSARVRQLIDAQSPKPKAFILSLESISQMDTTGLKALEELFAELEKQDIKLVFARPKTYMRRLRTVTKLGKRLDDHCVFATISAAVDWLTEGKETEPQPR